MNGPNKIKSQEIMREAPHNLLNEGSLYERLTRSKRRRLMMLVGLFACFSLFALVCAVYLNSKTNVIFSTALDEELRWENTRQMISELTLTAGRVNGPINDAFLLDNTAGQRELMREHYMSFRGLSEDLILHFDNHVDDVNEQITLILDQISEGIYDMMTEAEAVFSFLEADQKILAIDRMTVANSYYRDVLHSLSTLNEILREQSVAHFQQQSNNNDMLFFQAKVLISIVLVCFLTLVVLAIRALFALDRTQARVDFARELLSKTLNSVGDAVIGCDERGTITEWNIRAEELFGQDLNGRKNMDQLVPGIRQNLDHQLQRHSESLHRIRNLKGVSEQTYTAYMSGDSDDELIPDICCEITMVQMTHEQVQDGNDDHHTRWVFTICDCGEDQRNAQMMAISQAQLRLQVHQNTLVQAELSEKAKVLVEAKQKAEASTQAKSRFLAVISHELRTPLNSVLGFARILQKTTLNRTQAESLKRIVDASNHLVGIIDSVLDMSRIEHSTLSFKLKQTHLVDIVQSVIDTVSDSWRKKDVRFFCFIHPLTPVHVMTDETRLRQVLINLLSNASQFTDTGVIELEVMPDFEQLSNAKAGTVLIHFMVSDTGIGITEEQLSMVFEPFTQADTSNTRRHGGLGLGLTITKALIEGLGGDIDFDSVVNQGTKVRFSIPFECESKEQSRVVSPPNNQIRPIAVMSTDNRFIEWINRSLKALNQSALVVPSLNCQLLNWCESSHAEGIEPIIFLDGTPSDYGLTDEDQASPQFFVPEKVVRACVFMAELESVEDPMLVGENMLFLPVFPDQLLSCLYSNTAQAHVHDLSLSRVPSLRTVQVLIVDDVASNRAYLQGLLEPTGCKITHANDGASAVHYCESQFYDLILLDIHMNDMNGYDVSRRIKELKYAKKSVILGITADNDQFCLSTAIQSGMVTCLTKPLDMADFYEVIQFLVPPKANKKKVQVPEYVNKLPVLLNGDNHVNVNAALERIHYKVGLYRRLVHAFLERVGDLDQRFSALLNSEYSPAVAQYLSSVRGTALSVGAEGLGVTITNFEKAIEKRELAQECYEHCIDMLDTTIKAIKAVDEKLAEEGDQ